GIPLAYDTASYDVQFTWDTNRRKSSDRANYTRIFMKTIDIIEENGGKVIDTFMITKDKNGKFIFDVQDLDEKAQKSRVEKWCENMQISDAELTPEEMYYELRASYRIPEDIGFEEAMKLLSIWQEAQLGSYKSYLPVTIAQNVSYNTVLEIETRANELIGMSIKESSTRVYPKSTLAAHAIGYTGKITAEDDVKSYEELGYNIDNDTVGKSGIESTMEKYLTASTSEKKGARTISVDSSGGLLEELDYTGAKDGDDVILTIDVKMQEALEAALKKNIEDVHAYQVETYNHPDKKEKYDKLVENRKKQEVNMCISGSAIVIDPRTADVKAIASYPSFDLNLFVGGISDADFKALNEDEATPLFNNAVSSATTPGSIFKMCTGIAGLMEGVITTTTPINDEGPYTEHIKDGARAPACWVKPNYIRHANNQTIVEALKVSCNYFFYKVADMLGIEKLEKWVEKFGLTSETGIELTGEAVGKIGGQETLYDKNKGINEQCSFTPLLVYNRIYSILEEYGEDREVEYTPEMLTEATTKIVQLAGSVEGKTDYGDEIRDILSDVLDIPERISKTDYLPDGITRVAVINQYLYELVWTDASTVTQGIGAEPMSLTPIAVAKYVCAIANGGKVLQPHIVDRIVDPDGNVVYQTETTVIEDLDIPSNYMNAVHEGMKEVVSENQGGDFDLFKNFDYKDILAAKTGTGRVSEVDLENNGWFVCFAPIDDPEIAVVVSLPHGAAGIRSGQAAVDFLQYYFDAQNAVAETEQPAEGSLVE
ncbi:MAG: hypothetical protein IKK29_04515, partial [Christensenellaceae bacterium]|nr:hypothetical protein [Christensenellaceae bacterium]